MIIMGETKRYKLDSDMYQFHKDFHRLLPDIKMEGIKDGLMCVVNRYVTVDIIALDKELRRIYPDEWEHMSMIEIIEKHYGHEAVQFINAVI